MPALLEMRLWDPFYFKGGTTKVWRRLGVKNFAHSRKDFFAALHLKKFDAVVSNPPFSKKQLIVSALVGTGKPFVLLLRTSVLFSLWFRRMVPIFKLVLPSRQVDFIGGSGKKLSFGCVFVCVGCGPRRGLHACRRA